MTVCINFGKDGRKYIDCSSMDISGEGVSLRVADTGKIHRFKGAEIFSLWVVGEKLCYSWLDNERLIALKEDYK